MSKEVFLSKREFEIIRLLLKSYNQKMIAVELSVSVETIRSHMKHIYAKLGVHSLTELINWAHYSGLFRDVK